MNGIEAAFSAIIEKARETNNIVDGDYLGENNLYYCGKCNTAKQCAVEFLGNMRIVPCVCKCKEEEIKREVDKRNQQ